MIFMSIDPGIDGAVAIFNDKKLLLCISLVYNKYEKLSVLDVNYHIGIAKNLNIKKVFIEKVGSRRSQGSNSTFTFGSRFGEACTLARAITHDIEFITPQKWKKSVGLIGHEKKDSAKLAAKIYPMYASTFVEKNNRCTDNIKYYDGRGDAVCIGLSAIKLGLTKCII